MGPHQIQPPNHGPYRMATCGDFAVMHCIVSPPGSQPQPPRFRDAPCSMILAPRLMRDLSSMIPSPRCLFQDSSQQPILDDSCSMILASRLQAKPSAERIQHEFEIGNCVFFCLCFFLGEFVSQAPFHTQLQICSVAIRRSHRRNRKRLWFYTNRRHESALAHIEPMAMNAGHCLWPLQMAMTLAMACGHGRWPWPQTLASGHGL